MTLLRDDFAQFFAAVHDGHRPFAWQERLLTRVLDEGHWPTQVAAPTGAGKTAVIDVHVFAQALTAGAERPRPPRRLAVVVDRRVLVDDQHQHAMALATALVRPSDPVLAAVRDRLWTLRPEKNADRTGESPLVVGRLRGGMPPSRTWRDHPSAAAVLCATPDMWGSRLLFRGYGSSRRAWPREAGLLAFDSVVVVDEAHLSRQLLCTARRVGELAAVAEEPVPAAPVQVVETTATPTGGVDRGVEVAEDDLTDPVLDARLRRPKPVTIVPVRDWANAKSSTPVTALRDAVLDLLPRSGRTVGCFVNTVARAIAVTSALRGRTIDGHDLRVVLVCGQTRPVGLRRLSAVHPGLLDSRGDDSVHVLVSTQSLEVGVDLDLAGIVTELADGPALAQRAGRVNRRGLRPSGPITVTVPAEEITDRVRSGPYGPDALRAAREWLAGHTETLVGFAPWALRSAPPPPSGDRRMVLQRPELGQAWHWARTSDALAADPDLSLWLSEDLDDDASAGLVVRADLPVDDSGEAIALVRALPPRRHETFPVPIATARLVLTGLPTTLPAVVVRGDDVDMLGWNPPDEREAPATPRIRPGDTVVVHASAELFTDARLGAPVPVPADADVARFPANDALEAEATLGDWADRRVGRVVHRIDLPDAPLWDPAVETEARQRALVLAWLGSQADPDPMRRAAIELLRSRQRDSDVVVLQDQDDNPRRVLVLDRRRAEADEIVRQLWTPRGDEVGLDGHQKAVAARATELARLTGLAGFDDVLERAGRHHDDGKQDSRFQRLLGATDGEVLAKSRGDTTAAHARANARGSGLPQGWRHEQRSVADCWAALTGHPHAELVARLVGTSHGHGRSGFPHTSAELAGESAEPAEELFDLGGWDELIERTHLRYGVWGCAYLEALLRAADGQVSGEGR